jgi:hypothetical protein
MPSEPSDFTSKVWKVILSDSPPPDDGDVVTFSSVENVVTVELKSSTGSLRSEPGTYDPVTNSIKMEDGREIRLRITCEKAPGGGSWTAEDTSGSQGDGD